MPKRTQDETHPILLLGVRLQEIANRTGVERSNLSLVVGRYRHRLGYEANKAIKANYPTYAFDEAMEWRWARLRKFKPKATTGVQS